MRIKDQIRAEIERQKAYSEQTIKGIPHDLGLYYVGWMDLASKLLVFLDTHSEQTVEGLEEEIEMEWDSFNKHLAEYDDGSDEVVWLNLFSFEDIARHFAEWQYQKDRGEFAKLKAKEWSDGYNEGIAKGKEKMMEEALEAVVTTNLVNRPIIYLDQLQGFQYGDKVRVIVIKED